MIDLVIPLGIGSIWQNREIRFCLRSVERFLSGYGNVHIIGQMPDFLRNVEFTPFTESTDERIPDRNIMKKLKAACENENVSDPFLYMNDDHYLLTKFKADSFPNYYSGTLTEYCASRNSDPYGKRTLNTLKSLKSRGLSDLNYDVHYPMLIEKQKFIDYVVNAVDWSCYDGFVIKSLYANAAGVEGTEQLDYKTITVPHFKAKAFSSFPRVKPVTQRFLLEQFPRVSRFEGDKIAELKINH